jgi:hypothetical protein
MTGATTSGITALADNAAKEAFKKSTNQGLKKLAVRTGAGALTGN